MLVGEVVALGAVDLDELARIGSTVPGPLVANMVDHPARVLQEIHLDWHLIYRTREEMLDVARAAVPGARVRILEEESGVNPFFEIVRG